MAINQQLAFSTHACFSGTKPDNSGRSATSASDQRNRMFVLGMGYVGRFFANHLKNRGWRVTGTCTTDAKKKKLEEQGLNAYLFRANDVAEFRMLDMVKWHTHVLVSIPPVHEIGDLLLHQQKILMDSFSGGNLKWLGYLSSTSVYGDSGGALIDEDFEVHSESDATKLRLAAETGWLNLGHLLGISSQVFRLGGVYGPGRSAVNTLRSHIPPSESQRRRALKRYTSRIHVDDICQALEASISFPSSRRIYNIVDDDPASREEVFAYAESLIMKKWPDSLSVCQDTNQGRRETVASGLIGEKRVSNARLKSELGVQLLHSTYKSGLVSVLEELENNTMTF